MQVTIIFDPAFEGKTERAVWIIDTAANRKWFAEQHDLDPNSALFSTDRYRTIDTAVAQMVWNAQEHHPAWNQIEVTGATLTPSISGDLKGDALICATPTGFMISRS